VGLSILGLSYGLTPSGLARGNLYMTYLLVRCNIDGATRYHKLVIGGIIRRFAAETGRSALFRRV
jgi:hypothetical protein